VAFVRLLDGSGQLLAEQESEPVGGSLPTTAWQEGEVIEDKHELSLPKVTPGVYNLQIGLFDKDTARRLPVFDQAGRESGDHFLIEDVINKVQVQLKEY
jgi:hypothetical protein